MLSPYVHNEFDNAYTDAVEEAFTEEQFISQQIISITATIANHGANVGAEQLAHIDEQLKSLAQNYIKLREIQLRVKLIAQEARAAGNSILGYSPDVIAQQAELRASAYSSVSADLINAINTNFSAQDFIRMSSNVARIINVLGTAAGPAYDAAIVWKHYSDGNQYGVIAGTISGVMGVLAGVLVATAVTTSSLPVILLAGLLTGTLTSIAGAVIERFLVKNDILAIDELSPHDDNEEGKRRLISVREVIHAMDDHISYYEMISLLDASAGKPGYHIDNFFDMVRRYFDGGLQFSTMEDFALALRQSNFENNRNGFLVVDLSSLSANALYERAAENSPFGQSVRYALINMIPFATGVIEGTSAAQYVYDLSNFSDQYLKDRALFLQGYLDGMHTENVSLLNVNGGLDIFSRVNPGDPLYIRDLQNSIDVTNFVASPFATRIVFGSENGDLIVPGYGNGSNRFYGGGGNDTLEGGIGDDYLEGNDGDDILRGGGGNDVLIGGIGNDTYEFTGQFGRDTIFDSDGLGSIIIDGTALGAFSLTEGVYQFEGIQATRIAGDNNSHVLILSRVGDSSGNQIRIEDWQEGHLGITLDNTPPPAATPAHPEVLLGTNADEFFDLNLMQAGGGTRFGTAIGGGGHDYVWGTTESDFIYGGAGNDWIHGNLGAADQLYGEEGNDFILDASTGTRAYGGAGNDVLSAHAVARVHIGEWGLSSGDFWLLMREYLQPGFVTFVNRVEDIDYHSYSVWMGFTPGTYTFTSAEGVSYQLQVEGADLNAPFSGFHLGTAESDITNLQFLVNGNPQAYNLAWSRFTLNPDWTEEMAAELEGVMFDGGADDDLLVGWYSKDTLIGGDGNEAWGSPIYAKAA